MQKKQVTVICLMIHRTPRESGQILRSLARQTVGPNEILVVGLPKDTKLAGISTVQVSFEDSIESAFRKSKSEFVLFLENTELQKRDAIQILLRSARLTKSNWVTSILQDTRFPSDSAIPLIEDPMSLVSSNWKCLSLAFVKTRRALTLIDSDISLLSGTHPVASLLMAASARRERLLTLPIRLGKAPIQWVTGLQHYSYVGPVLKTLQKRLPEELRELPHLAMGLSNTLNNEKRHSEKEKAKMRKVMRSFFEGEI